MELKEIKSLTDQSRKDIYDFAMKRSHEIVHGDHTEREANMKKTLGQIAYEEYKRQSGDISVNGKQLKPWVLLGHVRQRKWEEAAKKIYVTAIEEVKAKLMQTLDSTYSLV
jgi:hypothetical protein